MTTRKDLRTGWLLFLLSDSRSYGYELRRELEVRGLELEPAVLYRSLRHMESAGMITSRWVQSGEGPSRRVYDVTLVGEAELARLVTALRASRDAHDRFLAAYDDHEEAALSSSEQRRA